MLRQLCLIAFVSSSVLIAGCAQQPVEPQKQTIYVYPKNSENSQTPDKWTEYKPYEPACTKTVTQK